MFFWLLEVTVVNSFIIYRQTTATPKTHIIYRRSLVEALATRCISSTPPRPRVGRPRKRCHPDSPERLNGHFHQLERREKQQDCIVCSKQSEGVRFRTYFYCSTCTTRPTLHPWVCYNNQLQAAIITYLKLNLATSTPPPFIYPQPLPDAIIIHSILYIIFLHPFSLTHHTQ